MIFGIGWGLGGICPGPGLIVSLKNPVNFAFWFVPFVFGQQLSLNLFYVIDNPAKAKIA